MLASITLPVLVLVAVGVAFRSGRTDPLITRRPYNNQHSDANGARDDSFV
jgi:hypothetical protein